MSLFLYTSDIGKSVCITDEERMNILENITDVTPSMFTPIVTEEDFKKCLQSKTFKHPLSCSSTYAAVIRNIEQNMNQDMIMSPFPVDFAVPEYEIDTPHGKLLPIRRLETSYDFLQDGFYTVYLKVGIFYTFTDKNGQKISSIKHVFPIAVDMENKDILVITAVDTAPISYSKQGLLKAVKNFLKAIVDEDIDLDEVVNYPVNDLAVNVQESEKILLEKGYCKAWMLYFIYSQAIKGDDPIEMFEWIMSLSPLERVIVIMIWWDQQVLGI